MKFVLLDDLKTKYGIPHSRVSLWRLEKEGRFPKRVAISPGRIGWLESEIEAWIKLRADARPEAA